MHRKGIPQGLTHKEDEVCPFVKDAFPIGSFPTCCSLRGKVAAYELADFGEDDLCNAMYEDMTCDEAVAFAKQLCASADLLEQRQARADERSRGSGANGTLNKKKNESPWSSYSSLEEAVASIRDAARWYEKIGHLGFGVHAWS